MIKRYWSEMFKDFEVAPGRYEVPGFPEPLLSAHFGVANLIGEEPQADFAQLLLCTFRHGALGPVGAEPLERVGEAFWKFQEENYPETVAFLRRLVPLLITREHPHEHLFLWDQDGLTASGIIGYAPSGSFIFNASVRKDLRGQGLTRQLLNGARGRSPAPLFYWTRFPWLTGGAQRVESYQVKLH